MTDNTKMRDDAIREAARNHAGDEYFNADRAHLLVSPYSGRIFDAGFDRGWQAAQSAQAVPVVGEPTKELAALAYQQAFAEGEVGGDFSLRIARHVAALIQPTHSITAAELERLRKDAERYRWLHSSSVGPATVWRVCMEPMDGGLYTLKSDSCLDEAIDAAIAGEGSK